MKKLNGTTVIIIPAFKPNKGLLEYIDQLYLHYLTNIVIVNDGSGSNYESIFLKLANKGCIVLKHHKNLGKGAALKTAFHYVEQNFAKDVSIVTADADGQHDAGDVVRLAQESRKFPQSLILGVRDFSKGDTPFKSLFGNRVTSIFFSLLYGERLSDTQTGLRAFNAKLLPFLQSISGTRFEYELEMIISCIRANIAIHTIPIQVIYKDGNSGTHFKAIRDSVRVMSVLFMSFFKFISTSLIGATVDIGIAWLLLDLLRSLLEGQDYVRILIATVSARIISIMVNYLLNKNFVFKSKGKESLWRYLSLSLIIILSSSTGVYFIHIFTPINDKIAKLICDVLLFILSYYLQQKWVFKKKE